MEEIGPYRVVAELGRGGAGIVYRVRTPAGGEAALKLLLGAGDHQRRRFRREVSALTRLKHPNLVPVLDVGEAGGRPYLVLEYVPGESLDAHLQRTGPLDPEDAVRLTLQLAGALDHAHGCGLVHRDVKPANVLLDRQGRARLTDFGLVRDLDLGVSKLSQTGVFMGTPAYWPPEQALGRLEEIGPHSDVFALGATLYHMLAGRPPGADALKDALQAVETRAPVEPPSRLAPQVDPALDAIVLRCLEPDLERRFDSAAAVAEALAAWQVGEERTPPRARSLWVSASLMLVGLAAAVGVVATRSRGPRSSAASPSASPVASPESSITPATTLSDRGEVTRDLLERAQRAHDADDLEACERLLRRVLELDPEHVEAWFRLGGVLGRDPARREQAVEALGRAIELDPDQVQARIHRGQLLSMLGRNAEALTDLWRAAALRPDDAAVHLDLALVLRQLERPREAVAALDVAARLAPRQATPLQRRGLAYEAAGELDAAIRDLERAMALEPALREARFHLARIVAGQGDQARARELYLELGRRDPTDFESRTNAAVCALTLEHLDEAEPELRALVAEHPNVALPHFNLGNVQIARGDMAAALPHVERAVELDPEIEGGYRTRGNLRLFVGDAQGALADYEQALARDPRDLVVLGNRVMAYYGLQDFNAALEAANAHLAVEESRKTLMTRTACLGMLGRFAEALDDAERCIELDPADPKAYLNAARAGSSLGERERLHRILARGLEATHDDPTLRQAWTELGFDD